MSGPSAAAEGEARCSSARVPPPARRQAPTLAPAGSSWDEGEARAQLTMRLLCQGAGHSFARVFVIYAMEYITASLAVDNNTNVFLSHRCHGSGVRHRLAGSPAPGLAGPTSRRHAGLRSHGRASGFSSKPGGWWMDSVPCGCRTETPIARGPPAGLFHSMAACF